MCVGLLCVLLHVGCMAAFDCYSVLCIWLCCNVSVVMMSIALYVGMRLYCMVYVCVVLCCVMCCLVMCCVVCMVFG